MTVTTVFSSAADGLIFSENATYATARAGSGLTADTAANVAVGQAKDGADPYFLIQGFVDFDTSSIPDTDVVSAIVLSLDGVAAPANTTILEVYYKNWDPTLTTADWTTSFGSRLASFDTAGYSAAYNDFTSDAAFLSVTNLKTGVVGLVIVDANFVTSTPPGANIITVVDFASANAAGTTTDPKLTITHAAGGTEFTQTLTGSLTPAGGLAKAISKPLGGSVTGSGALAKLAAKPLAGSSAFTGALTKLPGKVVGGAITLAGALVRDATKALAGSLTAAGGLAKQTDKPLAGSITPTGDLSMLRVIILLLEGSLTMTGNLTRSTSKALAGSVMGVGSLVKDAAKSLAGSITPTGDLSMTRVIALLLTGTLAMTGSLTRETTKVLSGVLTPVGTLGKQTAKLLSGVITLAGNLIALLTQAERPTVTEFPGLDDAPLRSGLDQSVAYGSGVDDIEIRLRGQT